MKRLASAVLIAFGALSLHADEQKPAPAQTPAPQPQAQADSPLVRAAKTSQRSTDPKDKKKKIVITNETLAKSGGHITTASSKLPPLPQPPKPDAMAESIEMQRKYSLEQQAAAKAKKEAEDKKKALAAEHANAIYDGDDAAGIYEDPATTEGRMKTQSPSTPQQPPTIQVQKPPTSSR